ncbi:MAG: hypothetical protein NWF01_09185 [Candidatus Bathyarchaeota archaeon]|nr:hypothetical protein [Candidatus Bathyarchaeota archaeon]
MRERHYLVFTMIFMVITLGAVLFLSLNDLNTKVYTRHVTIESKFMENGNYMVNCTDTTFEIQNSNATINENLYNSIIENKTYTLKLSFDIKNNIWNILEATPATP